MHSTSVWAAKFLVLTPRKTIHGDVLRSWELKIPMRFLWVLVILYLILFMAIDKHDQSAGVCK